jgi:DDE superfamily endonuclease
LDAAAREVPGKLAAWMQPFRDAFTAPTWQHVLVLVMGAILVPGRRTVASVLRVMERDQAPQFTNYHRVLNRNKWAAKWLARRLLSLLVDAFVPHDKPVVIGLDDTIERRWGARIKKRGIYRDPGRSSRGHFVKTSGLRWLSLMLLPDIPWAGRCWALPFLTVLAPSQRYWQKHRQDRRKHKKLTDWARQALIQAARWLPDRRLIVVGDTSFAAVDLLNDVRPWVTMITRLRLDAGLYHPPPRRKPRQRGRPRVVGKRQPTLKQRLANRKTRWRRLLVSGWYGCSERWRSSPAPHCGTIPAIAFPSVMCWCATQPANSSRRPSSVLILRQTRSTSFAGSSVAGRSRSLSPKSAAILASKPSGSGQTRPSIVRRRSCSGCSR